MVGPRGAGDDEIRILSLENAEPPAVRYPRRCIEQRSHLNLVPDGVGISYKGVQFAAKSCEVHHIGKNHSGYLRVMDWLQGAGQLG